MNKATPAANAPAIAAKNKLSSQFFKKGVTIGLLSGLVYGLYTAFLTLGMAKGVWADWYGPNTAGLSAFFITFVLGALGSAVNDSISGVFALINVGIKGKMSDFFRTIKTVPGVMMILAALIGGPIASAAYIIAIQQAGSIVIPIAALNTAVGAVLGKVLFKQELSKRMVAGVAICVSAGALIGSTGLGGDAPEGLVTGIGIALIAALGWGLEGCVAGFGTSMIDSEIGITIRQTTSGLGNLLILLPVFGIIGGNPKLSMSLTLQAFTSGPAMIWFLVSGICAYYTFMFWYKGNGMCGAALGMACNGTYSFWGPFFSWILLGVIFGMEGMELPPVAWVAAVLMAIGISVIAMNPMDLFKKEGGQA
ncbi:hypothetical protein [Alkaliphilus sp. B6464]|uniref:hypothetical protein n=1 Tax=Alkaliphilus sp. B6464 TaxID=2731219 RepID=UPI001BA4E4E5|nr:hypothetical protein [Alkaliphilus sp. B6464]QUH19579.1 hypothetical protein HYG84_06525 [Alkaliphilus sp. B6464]